MTRSSSLAMARKRRRRGWFGVALYALVITLLMFGVDFYRPTSDFAAYWAAAHLQAKGANPYDPGEILSLQQTIGWSETVPRMIWYPPWALSMLMPLGFLSYPASRMLWLALNLSLLLCCSAWLWRFYAGSVQMSWLPSVLVMLFTPAFLLLAAGQTTGLVLLGVVLCLRFVRRERWWFAGASVALVAIKPQLAYLLFVAGGLWAVRSRRWAVLLGAALTLAGLTAIALMVNPYVARQYLYTISHYPPDYWITPTAGAILRLILGWQYYWLQFLPSLVGLIWLLVIWQQRKQSWSWDEEMPLILIVSTLTTSFAWMFDLVVLLVPVIQVVILLQAASTPMYQRRVFWLFLGISALIFVTLPLMAPMVQNPESILTMTSPNRSWAYVFVLAYAILYLMVRRRYRLIVPVTAKPIATPDQGGRL